MLLALYGFFNHDFRLKHLGLFHCLNSEIRSILQGTTNFFLHSHKTGCQNDGFRPSALIFALIPVQEKLLISS
jgi:hypothetical protein